MSKVDERRAARLEQRKRELQIRAEQVERNREAEESGAGGVTFVPEGEQRPRTFRMGAEGEGQKAADGPAENKSRTAPKKSARRRYFECFARARTRVHGGVAQCHAPPFQVAVQLCTHRGLIASDSPNVGDDGRMLSIARKPEIGSRRLER